MFVIDEVGFGYALLS